MLLGAEDALANVRGHVGRLAAPRHRLAVEAEFPSAALAIANALEHSLRLEAHGIAFLRGRALDRIARVVHEGDVNVLDTVLRAVRIVARHAESHGSTRRGHGIALRPLSAQGVQLGEKLCLGRILLGHCTTPLYWLGSDTHARTYARTRSGRSRSLPARSRSAPLSGV